jgi:hypothetical protein
MRTSLGGRIVRLLLLLLVVMITGAASARTDQSSRAIPASSSPTWEHIRAVGQRLGVPRTLTFGSPSSRSLGIGDFDGDGDVDVAVAADGASEVFVLLGDTSRPFAETLVAERADWPTVDAIAEVARIVYRAQSSALSAVTNVTFETDNSARSANPAGPLAVVADFDNDGIADMAAAPAGSVELLVYMGHTDGASRFAGRVSLAATPVAMGSGDFNGDGATDLVVADGRSTSVGLVFGDGSGGFVDVRVADLGVRPALHGLAVGDIDRDGIADLVVLGDASPLVNVLLGDRNGGLLLHASAVVDFPLPSSAIRAGGAQRSLADSSDDRVALSSDPTEYHGIVSLTLNPTSITGGSGGTSTATITLNAPAPAGGVVVTLTSSNTELAASVPSITVPAGATTATFTVGTNKDYRRYSGLAFNVTISATHGTTTRSATLSVGAQPQPGPLSSFDVQNEGQMCFGVGVRRTASGHELELGSAGNLFDCVPPKNPVGQDGTCTFRQECSLGCEFRPPIDGFKFKDVCATTGPFPVAVNPKLLVGGNPSLATLQLSAPAPASSSGILSAHTLLANTIPSISFPMTAGTTSANADVLTARVASPGFAPIDGSYSTPRPDGSRGGRGGLTWMALVPGTPPPFRLTSLIVDPATTVGGRVVFATGQMNQVAAAPEIAVATMRVSSSDPAVVSIQQPDVTFTHGSSSATFAIQTQAVAADRTVTITAVLGDTTLTKQLTVTASPAATHASSFFLNPLQVRGGDLSTGTVVLDGAAPSGGAVVTLTSGNTAVARMPASVTVPAGSDRTSFTVETSAVTADTTVSLTATYGNGSAFTSLTVLAPPPPLTLASLALNPSSVVGGNTSTGTATLSAAAPPEGAVVTLSSSHPAFAAVPASVTVPAGAASANFTVTTSTVSASTTVNISGSFGGTTQSATLTVTPASTGPLAAPSLLAPANDARFSPGQAIMFDWTDVSGAASYTIQIDDSDTFSLPLVVSATVTASTYTNGTLPATRMWWRVRANDGAGNAGAWSAVRRVEVRN